MRTIELMKGIEFNDNNPQAQLLHGNEEGRVFRFAFLPGQGLEPHRAPSSPIHMIVIQGKGAFAGEDGVERICSEGMMVSFDAGETHSVRALDEILVFISVYKEAPSSHNSEYRKQVEAARQHHSHPQGETNDVS